MDNTDSYLINELHKHLKTVSRHDRSVHPRPFFVEFSGTPSSGKTTAITELDKFLRRQDLRVWRPQEGAEVIRHMPRGGPLFNIRTALYVLEIIIDQCQNAVYDVILFDRGIFDAMTWTEHWYSKGGMGKSEQQTVRQFLELPYWVSQMDCVLMMVCDPKEAVRRDLRIAQIKAEGPSTNADNLAKLVEIYKKLQQQFPQIHLMDTTMLSEADMVKKVIHLTLNGFAKTIRAG